jgi:hypothetical protein
VDRKYIVNIVVDLPIIVIEIIAGIVHKNLEIDGMVERFGENQFIKQICGHGNTYE